MPFPVMTRSEIHSRYAKQQLFEPIGAIGQQRLGAARVLICGCGATGGTLADLLARAGVGFLRVADRDIVELTNLQRQTLFSEEDVANRTPKAIAAASRLRAINAEIQIEPHVVDIGPENILQLAEGVDLIVDGTDNFETRFLINDAALELGLPWVYTGVLGGQGQSLVVLPNRPGCLRCVMDTPPPPGSLETCDTAGVIGPAVAAVAGLSAASALRLLVSGPEAITPKLMAFDVWEGNLRGIGLGSIQRGEGCPTCAGGERAWLHGQSGSRSAILCGRNAVQITPASGGKLDLSDLARRLAPAGPTTQTSFLIRHTTTEPACEVTIFRDGRAIIQGTEDIAVAKTVYARLIGA